MTPGPWRKVIDSFDLLVKSVGKSIEFRDVRSPGSPPPNPYVIDSCRINENSSLELLDKGREAWGVRIASRDDPRGSLSLSHASFRFVDERNDPGYHPISAAVNEMAKLAEDCCIFCPSPSSYVPFFNINHKPPTTMSILISKFKSLVRQEPEKSFISLGITQEDGTLTAEGLELFVQHLFENKAMQGDFYEIVVKKLSEEKAKK